MIFEIGKTYRHSKGIEMTIIGKLETHTWGTCLIGETSDGCLVPVGELKENAVGWIEEKSEEEDD